MDAGGILSDDAVLVGLPFSQVGDSEVVFCDCGVVAFQPAVVVPLICAVHFPFHHVTNDLAAAIVEGHGPAQRHRGACNVCDLRFARRI